MKSRAPAATTLLARSRFERGMPLVLVTTFGVGVGPLEMGQHVGGLDMHEGVAVVEEKHVAQVATEIFRHSLEGVQVEEIRVACSRIAVIVGDAGRLVAAQVAADSRLHDQGRWPFRSNRQGFGRGLLNPLGQVAFGATAPIPQLVLQLLVLRIRPDLGERLAVDVAKAASAVRVVEAACDVAVGLNGKAVLDPRTAIAMPVRRMHQSAGIDMLAVEVPGTVGRGFRRNGGCGTDVPSGSQREGPP